MSDNERSETQEFDFSKEIETPIEMDTSGISESVKTFSEKKGGMEEMEYYEDEPEISEEAEEKDTAQNNQNEGVSDGATINVSGNIMDTSKIIHREGNSGVVQNLVLLPTDSIRIPTAEVEKTVEVSSFDSSEEETTDTVSEEIDIHEVNAEDDSAEIAYKEDDYPDEDSVEDSDEDSVEDSFEDSDEDFRNKESVHQNIELLPEDELDDDVPLTKEEAEALEDLSYHDEDVKRKKPAKTESEQKKKKAHATGAANTGNVKKQSSGSHQGNKKKVGVFDILLIVGAVAAIILICILAISFILRTRSNSKIEKLAYVGNQLTTIGNIGEKGINEIVANKMTTVVESVSEEQKGKETSEEKKVSKDISVNFSSVEKDLKIKFTDKQTDSLIKGVLFRVEARTPDGKTVTWEDSDKDGIICMDNLTPGKYYVRILDVEDYVFPDTESEVTVKDKISYTAINIVNEIKKEKDVNVALEDKNAKAVDTGTVLQDTVSWVDSAKKEVYTEISKDKVTEPQAMIPVSKSSYNAEPSPREGSGDSGSSGDATVQRISSLILNDTSCMLNVGDTASLSASAKDGNGNDINVSFRWSTSDANVATVDGFGVVTAKGTGSAVITCFAKDATGIEMLAYCNVEVKSSVHYVTGVTAEVNPGTSLKVGESAKITASVSTDGGEVDTSVNYSSSDNNIVTVASDGTIQAKGEGSATITVSSNGKQSNGNSATTTITITVAASNGYVTELTLDKLTLSIGVGASAKLTATVKTDGGAVDNSVSWISSDENIATVGSDGTVNGKSKGTVTITCKTAGKTKEGKEISASCSVTVGSAMNDTTSVLTYKRENGVVVTLYVKDGDNYREAKYADYYNYTVFYIKEERYFGWQSENGITRYYNSDGKYVTGEQVIGGVKYNFASDGALSVGSGTMGIDVSKWNGTINWSEVKKSGVSFVIIRCGYRGCTQGGLIEDPNFHTNASGAEAAGLKVGVYFFSQAINEREAVEEASMAISMAQSHRISYPIFIDSEYGSNAHNARADGLGKAERTAVCRAFCETVRSAGYTPGVYASKSWYYNNLDAGSLNNYKIWLAHYCSQTDYTGKYELWQSSSTGRINGINGNVDINTSYLGY